MSGSLGSLGRERGPGLRAYQYGTLYYVGYAGYIWSSTIPTGSGSAHRLGFGYGGICPQSNNSRAYGFQLRCLQAFIVGCFVFFFLKKRGETFFFGYGYEQDAFFQSAVPGS